MRRTISPIAVAISAVLLSGCGGPFGAGAGDGSNSSKKPRSSHNRATEAELLFGIRTQREQRSDDDITAFWVADKAIARGRDRAVVGYDKRDGKQKWSVSLSGTICAASDNTADGLVAVTHTAPGSAKDCSRVAVINLNTGDKSWERRLPEVSRSRQPSGDVEIVGNTVAASRGEGAAWRLSDGKPRWREEVGDRCSDEQYVAGQTEEALLAVRLCGKEYSYEAVGLDPVSGRTRFRYRAGGAADSIIPVSASPAIVADQDPVDGRERLTVLDDNGTPRSRISVPRNDSTLDRPVVSDDAIYLASKRGVIRGYDLGSGRHLGTARVPGVLNPLGMDAGKLLAYEEPTLGGNEQGGGAVHSIDPDTYEVTERMRNPDKTMDTEADVTGYDGNEVYEDGRLYLNRFRGADDDPGYDVLVFGRN
jgi:outer membrane protein assembly factor BamB